MLGAQRLCKALFGAKAHEGSGRCLLRVVAAKPERLCLGRGLEVPMGLLFLCLWKADDGLGRLFDMEGQGHKHAASRRAAQAWSSGFREPPATQQHSQQVGLIVANGYLNITPTGKTRVANGCDVTAWGVILPWYDYSSL